MDTSPNQARMEPSTRSNKKKRPHKKPKGVPQPASTQITGPTQIAQPSPAEPNLVSGKPKKRKPKKRKVRDQDNTRSNPQTTPEAVNSTENPENPQATNAQLSGAKQKIKKRKVSHPQDEASANIQIANPPRTKLPRRAAKQKSVPAPLLQVNFPSEGSKKPDTTNCFYSKRDFEKLFSILTRERGLKAVFLKQESQRRVLEQICLLCAHVQVLDVQTPLQQQIQILTEGVVLVTFPFTSQTLDDLNQVFTGFSHIIFFDGSLPNLSSLECTKIFMATAHKDIQRIETFLQKSITDINQYSHDQHQIDKIFAQKQHLRDFSKFSGAFLDPMTVWPEFYQQFFEFNWKLRFFEVSTKSEPILQKLLLYESEFDKINWKFLRDAPNFKVDYEAKKLIFLRDTTKKLNTPKRSDFNSYRIVVFPFKSNLFLSLNFLCETNGQKILYQQNLLKEKQLAAFNLIGQVFTCLNSGTVNLVSLDFEAFELQQDSLLEVGFTKGSCWLSQAQELFFSKKLDAQHLIFEENLEFENGRYCENNRDGFLFGHSRTLPQDMIRQIIQVEIEAAHFVICHNADAEKNYLAKLGVPLTVPIIDTQKLAALLGSTKVPKLGDLFLSLGGLTDDTPPAFHNAGNDAFYTFQVFMQFLFRYRT